MGAVKRITDKEKALMVELYTNGKTVTEVANEVHRDPSNVRKVLKAMNVYVNTINYMSEEEFKQLQADYLSGMTPKELSEKYKRGSGYIVNKLQKAGIFKPVNHRFSKEMWDDIIKLYSESKLDEIVKKYNVGKQAIYSKMSEFKVRYPGKNYWSEEDIQIVKDNYLDHSTEEVYEMIGRRHTKSAINSYAFKSLNLIKSNDWTEEEDKLLVKYYSTTDLDYLASLLPNRTKLAITERANHKFYLKSKFTLETFWNKEDSDFVEKEWLNMSDQEMADVLNKDVQSVKSRRVLLGLHRVHQDKSGYTDLAKLFRGQIWNWKQQSIEKCNYVCVITGSKEFQVHHLYNFNHILSEFIEENNITDKNLENYSTEELNNLCKKFVEFHNKYSLGVCLRTDIHELYHKVHGKYNNTPEQFDRFKKNYLKGKYKEIA